jgi:hypothetical protein
MRRLFLAEKSTATNQSCAVLPWIEFYNRIGGRADEFRVKANFGARMSVAGDERSYLGHSWNRRL